MWLLFFADSLTCCRYAFNCSCSLFSVRCRSLSVRRNSSILHRVHHCGVVLVAELAANLRQAGLCHLLGQYMAICRAHTLRELFFCFRSTTLMPKFSLTAR